MMFIKVENKMKRNLIVLSLLILYNGLMFAQNAKYVFYFIGDGMGVNQVQGTEYYQAELKDIIGISPLCFTQFPVSTIATTFSATHRVTDSAAAGTALATGYKTRNGAIGVLEDLKTPVSSIGVWAKNKGCKVGIATSVSIDHATPAAFYAHVSGRDSYYNIGKYLYEAGFDFYGGSDFLEPVSKKDKSSLSLYDMAEEKGYVIARGYEEYKNKCDKADKMILFQNENVTSRSSLLYSIDRKDESTLTLEKITSSAIDFLYTDNPEGFFLMVEGGKIDWACHSNDAATVFHEIQDFNSAIKKAYDFYLQHPDETLIVVTADHETGGIALSTGKNEMKLSVLSNQKVSENGFTKIIRALQKKYDNQIPWEAVKNVLKENFGFWDKIELTTQQEARLKKVYDASLGTGRMKMEKSEYSNDAAISAEAKRIINEIAMVGWTSGDHSAGYVPVFAIGVGSERFSGRLDNTDIPVRIAESAGYVINK